MILRELKQFILSSRVVSLQQLSRHFQIEADALLPMLQIWQRKGVIRPCESSRGCSKPCSGCQPSNQYFEAIA